MDDGKNVVNQQSANNPDETALQMAVNGLIGCICFVGCIDHNGLIGFIGFGYVSFIGLSLVSLIGLINHIIGHISLINASAISNHWLIGRICLILIMTTTARHAAHILAAMLASTDKICNAMILNYFAASLSIHLLCKINAAMTKILRPQQAAATHLELGVTKSANKIANALALYFCTASLYYSYWFVREKWVWHVLSRLNSFFFGDVLQNAEHFFSTRLPQMTKYCVMRECGKIH
jgi:hypothetical protein